ncbi:glutamate ligase domain-containing protein, partial [Corynebacterium casei]
ESISAGLAAYRVDAHRGEVVHEADGVKFIDNSKATNPHAVEAALAGLSDVIWIAGGQLKGAEVDDLVEKHHLELKAAVLLGQDREILAAALKEHAPELPVVLIEDTDGEEAMQRTVAAALQHAEAGDTVLLAPAAASLDMYSGMSQRGDLFALNARKLTQGEELKQ